MEKIITRCINRLIVGIALCCTQLHASEVLLNGRGIASKFNADYFLAELFVGQTSNSSEDILSNDRLKMQLTVMVDKWSRRQFSQHWNQAILINNTPDARQSLGDEIARLLGSVEDSLQQGDQLVWEKTTDNTMVFTVNGIKLYATTNDQLINIFLKTWIGSRPPSSDFKAGLLGQPVVSDERYFAATASAPSKNRIAEIRRWLAKNKTAQEASNRQAGNTDTPITATGKRTGNLSKQQPVTTVNAALATDSNADSKTKSTDKAGTKPQAVSAPVANTVAASATSGNTHPDTVNTAPDETAPIVADQSQPQKKSSANDPLSKSMPVTQTEQDPVIPATPVNEEDSEDPLLKVYRSNILTLTYQNLIYPNSAIDRGHEGRVLVKLTLNRSGKVKKIKFDQKSQYTSLNKAVEKAVSLASPYPEPPKRLRGKEIVITLPVVFSLSG